MKYYELTINIKKSPRQSIGEGQTDSLLEKAASCLPGRVVRQQTNSSFLSLEFYSEPEKIQELEKKLKENSLKYMILVKESPEKTVLTQKRSKRTVTKPKPKVELKEIDKKLEEILKE